MWGGFESTGLLSIPLAFIGIVVTFTTWVVRKVQSLRWQIVALVALLVVSNVAFLWAYNGVNNAMVDQRQDISRLLRDNDTLLADNDGLLSDNQGLVRDNHHLVRDNRGLVRDNEKLVRDNARLVGSAP